MDSYFDLSFPYGWRPRGQAWVGMKLRESPGINPLTPLRDSRGEFCPKSPKLGHPHPLQAVGVGDDFGVEVGA